MKKMQWAGAALVVAMVGNAHAIPDPESKVEGSLASDTETQAYAGLSWTLGGKNSSMVPELLLGVRYLTVKSSDRVNKGVDLSGRFTFANGFALDSSRLSYVGGHRDALGLVGIGYSYTNKSALTTVAVQGAYARVGIDYELANKSFLPYLDLLTVKQPKKVEPALSCSAGGTLPPDPQIGQDCDLGQSN